MPRSETADMTLRPLLRRRALAVVFLGALGACASTPPPTDAISAADLALQQAETAQAATYAPGDVLRARTQLDNAKAEMRNENYDRARRLAEQSTVDSQVAIAKSRAAVAEAANKAAQESASALRQQTTPGALSPPVMTIPAMP
jgi:Domain of unknown function (DUF4398)